MATNATETEKSFNEKMEEWNKTVHPVETQWHYPILTKYGYEAITKEAVGFVRCYKYKHPKFPTKMIVYNTGVNCDYWNYVDAETQKSEKFAYWSDLEPFLQEKDLLISTL